MNIKDTFIEMYQNTVKASKYVRLVVETIEGEAKVYKLCRGTKPHVGIKHRILVKNNKQNVSVTMSKMSKINRLREQQISGLQKKKIKNPSSAAKVQENAMSSIV